MIKRLLFIIFLTFSICSTLFSKKMPLVYNCPNFNVYLEQKLKGNELILNGIIENLYYVALMDVSGEIDGISNGKIIEKRNFYIPLIGEWQDVDSRKSFKVIFKHGKEIKTLKFTINFNYASWKEGMDNYEYFNVKVQNR